jgi:hypothetical protein
VEEVLAALEQLVDTVENEQSNSTIAITIAAPA